MAFFKIKQTKNNSELIEKQKNFFIINNKKEKTKYNFKSLQEEYVCQNNDEGQRSNKLKNNTVLDSFRLNNAIFRIFSNLNYFINIFILYCFFSWCPIIKSEDNVT